MILSVPFLFIASCSSYLQVLEFQPRRGAGKMYAETGLLLPCMQGFPQVVSGADQHLLPFTSHEDLVSTVFPGAAPTLGNLVQISFTDYDLGGDRDLFEAPKPILEESLDPITATMSVMPGYGSTITEETMKTTVAAVQTEEDMAGEKDNSFAEGSLQKSGSFGCLGSVDYSKVLSVEPCFLGVTDMNLQVAFQMRRAYSEGDIQILGNNNSVHGNMNTVPTFKVLASFEDIKIEDKIKERRIKLSRYRKKRTKRNYGRKIKYACRKALAESQPRIHGRFAKMEDTYGCNDRAIGGRKLQQ
ncbi:zinc finger protein CONSTANS-LIKE 4-like isoform X2 [Musa acuminata AAA Group]|uniref:zinc finger protein CONSTANS-LIKE 4-like isoform X2 n=1 Tax=Musa acuminata AAA Group TaxID=214697 RepID=UPI0031D1B555